MIQATKPSVFSLPCKKHCFDRLCSFALAIAALTLASLVATAKEEPVFSGPQVGEKLPPLPVRGVYDRLAGKEIELVGKAAGKPILLVFLHQLTRPSAAVTRILSDYAESRSKDGLECDIVWLAKDPSQAEEYLKNARRSLAFRSLVGISVDGVEGPGRYGLNRNVELTVLVGRDNKVTANFALVQPSVTDAPRILAEVTKLIGGKPPTLAELQPRGAAMMADRAEGRDAQLPNLLRAVIRKTATPDDVQKAAEAVEKYVQEHPAARRELGRIANAVVGSDKFDEYGTPPARDQLRKWAKKYPAPQPDKSREESKGQKPGEGAQEGEPKTLDKGEPQKADAKRADD